MALPLLSAPMCTPCAFGPDARTHGPVVVSVTDFAVARWRDIPSVALTGLRLRMGWYAMPGAVGLWLWSLPASRRSGSISVWTGDDELRRFVALPEHVAVMRRNRDRGHLRATTWRSERFTAAEVLSAAMRWIGEAR
ncbi:MAG TPA: hypothetical protein VGJ32_13815 [Solirubrobacteraceae bacterium]